MEMEMKNKKTNEDNLMFDEFIKALIECSALDTYSNKATESVDNTPIKSLGGIIENLAKEKKDDREINTSKINQNPYIGESVEVVSGCFKGLIGKIVSVDDTNNIKQFTVKAPDGNKLKFPETIVRLIKKEIKEECKEKILKTDLGELEDILVKIYPHKTWVYLKNGIGGDVSIGYLDKGFNEDKIVKMAYCHALRHHLKVKLRELDENIKDD